MWADPDVTQHIAGPQTRTQSWSRMRGYPGLWEYLGFGLWAIEELASGLFIGELGFANFKRDIVASMQNAPELAWVFVRSAHGKGYATEAARAAIVWGDAHLASERTVCMIAPENRASIRVAEKCGFMQFASGTYGDTPALFFERYRDGRDS